MNTLLGLMSEVFGDLKTHAEERDYKELFIILTITFFVLPCCRVNKKTLIVSTA